MVKMFASLFFIHFSDDMVVKILILVNITKKAIILHYVQQQIILEGVNITQKSTKTRDSRLARITPNYVNQPKVLNVVNITIIVNKNLSSNPKVLFFMGNLLCKFKISYATSCFLRDSISLFKFVLNNRNNQYFQ